MDTSLPPLPAVRDQRSRLVVDALVADGLLVPQQGPTAAAVVDRVLSGPGAPAPVADQGPLRRRMAEVAGYVGGAFVVSAVFLFFADQWDSLGVGERTAILVAIGMLLAGAGAALGFLGGGWAELRQPGDSVRRRLVSTLLVGAAVALASSVAVALDGHDGRTQVLWFCISLSLISLAGYLVAPSALGQAAIAAGVLWGVMATIDWFASDNGALVGSVVLLVAGAAWLAAGEARLWRELDPARVLGCALLFIGAQFPLGGADVNWAAYLFTAALGAVAFWLYVVRRGWPYLVTGVLALTVVVPEALLDWTSGSLGTAGALLLTGLTLLGACLFGLRLRQEVGPRQPA